MGTPVKNVEEYVERLHNSPRAADSQALIRELAVVARPEREGLFSAIGLLISEAILDHDQRALETSFVELRSLFARLQSENESQEDAGRLLGYIDVLQHARARIVPLNILLDVERESHAHRFLHLLSQHPGWSNKALAEALQVDDTEVSRVGRKLVERGLANKIRVGRQNFWEVTPKGAHALQLMERTLTPDAEAHSQSVSLTKKVIDFVQDKVKSST